MKTRNCYLNWLFGKHMYAHHTAGEVKTAPEMSVTQLQLVSCDYSQGNEERLLEYYVIEVRP